ncbi:MAG TPA: FAD-dependent oxidoreductase [Xanthobacteraceae bacterium]|nr:FAD-dependent oxidoreductase [Xanthobacteraceae bacterium]
MDQYDIVIAGGGIAGLSAALTAARLGRKTMVLTGDVLGGQLLSIEKVDGYPGFPEGVPGYDLCPIAQEQAMNAGAEFSSTQITGIAANGDNWRVSTTEGDMAARAVIIATGADLKHLGVPGEERLTGKGVSHCATCDGPLNKNKVVAVVGGGDSAMQEALTLAEFASKTIILHHGDELTGQATYKERITSHPKIEVRPDTAVEEVLGENNVTGLRIRLTNAGSASDLEASSVFVYIGLKPATAFLGGTLKLDSAGAIPTDTLMRTELKGVCAAGTVRTGTPARAAASAGEGAAAAIAADQYLANGAWRS